MHILVGIVLALVLLYFWLLGHWFARIVAFLIFAAVLGLLGGLMTAQPHSNEGAIGGIIGIALAWPMSGIPIYWHRRKARTTSVALAP